MMQKQRIVDTVKPISDYWSCFDCRLWYVGKNHM